MNFFLGIPKSQEEAAVIDGAADYGEEMNALLHALHERNKRQCRVLCEYPTPVVFQYEDTSTTVMNTCMLTEYELPCVNEYAAIFHDSGKRFITHMCGKLDGFKGYIGKADMDGVDSVCPPTTGDLWPWEARATFGEKVIIGGIEPPGLARKTVREVLDDVLEILERMPSLQGFLLSTGDAVPFGTPIMNLIAVTRFIERLGSRSLTGEATEADVEAVLSQLGAE